jgi:hypothetical protein
LVCGAPAASPPPTPALSFLDYLDTPFSNLLDYQDAFLPEKREAEQSDVEGFSMRAVRLLGCGHQLSWEPGAMDFTWVWLARTWID